MQFKFSQYQYQTDAANAVCDVFDGQPLRDGVSYIHDIGVRKPVSLNPEPVQDTFDLDVLRPRQESLDYFDDLDDTGYRNADLLLTGTQLLSNIQSIQRKRNLEESTKLYANSAGAVELDVEMETGTGKTFVYTKTIFELNRRYGWSKFIVVVPSIAIREGVAKSLDMTSDYFYTSGRDDNEGYGKKLHFFIYDSANLTRLDEFAQSSDIQVMIINMQAFNTSMKENGRSKDARIIFSERDDFGSRRPIDVISATHPIMIMDEPQKMGGKATQAGIRLFKPLFTLNYSATHKTRHNLVYALDALDAYNQRLVKRIEVKGLELNNMHGTDGYLYLQDILVSKNAAPQARIEYKKLSASGKVVITSSLLNEGDDIYIASGELEAYREGWRIAPDGIVPDGLELGQTGYVRFMNGETLRKGQILNDGSEKDMRRIQIRETILSHLHKEEHLWARGIKCLSLFFIDEVAKYRQYDDSGEPLNGEYADIFEQEYDRCVHDFIENRLDDGFGYLNWLRTTCGRSVHKGYFSIDKLGHSIDSKIKRGSEESDDISAYDLILKNKERLLSFDEPTRFIFSHSALREGWDNPNVFQICTLKHSDNEIGKRQEVGRGLRLCVNRDGVRQDRDLLNDADFLDVNLLTVIASESYEKFAESLQKDIESDLRDRPLVIDDAFFTKTHVPVERLSPEYADLGDVSFSGDEAHDIVYSLTVSRLIDRNGKLTDKYKEDHFGGEAIELLPEPLRAKVPAIRLVLDSVIEGTATVFVGNALKRKVHANPLNGNWQKKEFQELWKRINHKYAYTVSFDDDELVDKAVGSINKDLVVPKLSYTVTRGIQRENVVRDQLVDRTHFHKNDSRTSDLDVDASNGVKYDLLGEIAQAATITRRCAARILKGIRSDKFLMFRDNPEQFIAKVGRLIVQEKASMVVDHICYDRLEGIYDSSIFTAGGNNRDEAEGYQASKCVQDWVFPDGKIEGNFAKDLDNAAEVAVYAKLPRGFQIPTPVGNYAPDWAVAFRDDSGFKHLFFVAETKGTLDSFDLRGVENSKIACAKRLFNELDLADGTHYEQATTYQTLLDEVKALQ